MAFTPIESQEQLDAIIADRIARAKESAVKEFADYNDIKTANADYEKQIAQLTEQVKGQSEKAEETAKTIADLEAKVGSYETASVKTRIAHETGLPYELADKLSGTTEDEIKADAEKMAKLFKSQPAAPMGAAEPDSGNVDPTTQAYYSMAKAIREE